MYARAAITTVSSSQFGLTHYIFAQNGQMAGCFDLGSDTDPRNNPAVKPGIVAKFATAAPTDGNFPFSINDILAYHYSGILPDLGGGPSFDY